LIGIALNCIYHFLSYGCFNLYSIDPWTLKFLSSSVLCTFQSQKFKVF
jgi:hypothetical protein